MFGLNREWVTLAHINNRTEKHGEDEVLAVDIDLELETTNAVLLKLSPTLRDCFYTKDPGATQDMIDPHHVPKVRNPEIGEIKWALEMESVRFTVFADGSDEEEIVIGHAKCKKFRFTCKEGGTVVLKFQVQKSEPIEMDVTKLLFLMGKRIKISLEEMDPPEDDGQGEGQDGQQKLLEPEPA